MLKENYEKVKENIVRACEKAGRSPEDVTLIAVSKTKPLSDIEELLSDTNAVDFGENKVQELVDKYENVSRPVNWHMIGHLQTNKVKYIVDKVCMIHSVDSLNLAKTIEKEAVKDEVIAAHVDHRFNGEHHSRSKHIILARLSYMTYIRLLMNCKTYSMAAYLTDNRIALLLCKFVDGISYISYGHIWLAAHLNTYIKSLLCILYKLLPCGINISQHEHS